MSFKIIGIGEVLWDLLPGGRQIGGAPANFAYHAGALGAEARVVSRVGNDELGRELVDGLKSLGLTVDCIELDHSLPTGTVTVQLGEYGEPQYIIHEGVAWENLSVESRQQLAVSTADAVCFGTLAQRSEPSRSTIRALVRSTPVASLRIFDVNLRQNYYSPKILEESLALANVVKMNESELPRLAEIFGLTGDERSQISQLAERHKLSAIAYTRDSRGSLLLSKGRWSDNPGVPVKIADTVGAGDSFTAAITLGLLAGWDLDDVNQHANELAAYVASCSGATPPLPERLREPFRSPASKTD